MRINKNKSIRKGFFFSRKRLPIALALSNGLFIHLLGCNAIQVKHGFVRNNLDTKLNDRYQQYSFDSSLANETYISKPAVNEAIYNVYKMLSKVNNSSDPIKADKDTDPEWLLDRIKILNSELDKKLNSLIILFRALYETVTEMMQTLDSPSNENLGKYTTALYNEIDEYNIRASSSININKELKSFFKECGERKKNHKFYNFYKIWKTFHKAQQYNPSKQLGYFYKIYQILHKEIYGRGEENSTINKEPKLLSDIQHLIQIGLDELKKLDLSIKKISDFIKDGRIISYRLDNSTYDSDFDWKTSLKTIYALLDSNVPKKPEPKKESLFKKGTNKLHQLICRETMPLNNQPISNIIASTEMAAKILASEEKKQESERNRASRTATAIDSESDTDSADSGFDEMSCIDSEAYESSF